MNCCLRSDILQRKPCKKVLLFVIVIWIIINITNYGLLLHTPHANEKLSVLSASYVSLFCACFKSQPVLVHAVIL